MNKSHLDVNDIMARLPHRPPFLLLDRVLSWGPKQVEALKNITINEPYFVGHFPNEPIVPGVLLGESLAQASAFLSDSDETNAPMKTKASEHSFVGPKVFLATMNLKIKRPAVPGDQLLISVALVKQLGNLRKIKGDIRVGREQIASADFAVTTSTTP